VVSSSAPPLAVAVAGSVDQKRSECAQRGS